MRVLSEHRNFQNFRVLKNFDVKNFKVVKAKI